MASSGPMPRSAATAATERPLTDVSRASSMVMVSQLGRNIAVFISSIARSRHAGSE